MITRGTFHQTKMTTTPTSSPSAPVLFSIAPRWYISVPSVFNYHYGQRYSPKQSGHTSSFDRRHGSMVLSKYRMTWPCRIWCALFSQLLQIPLSPNGENHLDCAALEKQQLSNVVPAAPAGHTHIHTFLARLVFFVCVFFFRSGRSNVLANTNTHTPNYTRTIAFNDGRTHTNTTGAFATVLLVQQVLPVAFGRCTAANVGFRTKAHARTTHKHTQLLGNVKVWTRTRITYAFFSNQFFVCRLGL